MQQILEDTALKIIGIHDFLYFGFLGICVVIGIILLIKAGDVLSEAAATLAVFIGIPPILVGLTVVSVATSAPELFTSISAIASNAKGLILGNILGSNIANIGLILGISLLIKPMDIVGAVPRFQRFTLLLVTSVFSGYLFFIPSQSITREFGLILVLFLISYLIFISYEAMRERKVKMTSLPQIESEEDMGANKWQPIALIALSSLGLWLGSESLVFGSKSVALKLGIPEELIGFSIVAVGTSLPELAASIALLKKSQTAMLLGNIIGSNLFNIGLVGGVAGMIAPIKSNVANPWVDHIAMICLTGMLCRWLNGKKIGKSQGVILLSCYIFASVTTWVVNL